MVERIKVVGNDIELDDKKIARLFDITSIQMQDLREVFDKSNDYDTKVKEAYEEGKQHHVYTEEDEEDE
jgi:hypothetical protein